MQKQQPSSASKPKPQKPLSQPDEQSYWQLMINGIVRPPRAKYNNSQLGNRVVTYKDKAYVRKDASILHNGKNIQMTLYEAEERRNFALPYVILYMHGNSSCRVEALSLIKSIPIGVSLASFDFMGCGKNQQSDIVTLGLRQAEQAATVTQYLRKLGYRVVLWGRSMGAATALLYGQAEFIVADSSYKSFKSLCKQVAKEHSPMVVPNCMINCFFPCVFSKMKKDIDRKAQYDIENLDVKQAVLKLNPDITVVFMSGNHDLLINKRNSEKLYDSCPCKKKYLKIFEGDHNSKRPDSIMADVMQIIFKHIKSKQPPQTQIQIHTQTETQVQTQTNI